MEDEDVGAVLEAARRGDQRGYRELYRRFRPLVVRLLDTFSGLDRDEGADVLQESFVRAFKSLHQLKDGAAFEPWLLAIARNRAMSAQTRKSALGRALRHAGEQGEEDLLVPPIPRSLLLERDLEVIRRFIEELPDGPEKQTVQMFYVEGKLSAREIAEALGVGKSVVTMRLDRFRAKIRETLLRRLLEGRLE